MGTYDTRGGTPASPDIPEPWISDNAETMLALMEDFGCATWLCDLGTEAAQLLDEADSVLKSVHDDSEDGAVDGVRLRIAALFQKMKDAFEGPKDSAARKVAEELWNVGAQTKGEWLEYAEPIISKAMNARNGN